MIEARSSTCRRPWKEKKCRPSFSSASPSPTAAPSRGRRPRPAARGTTATTRGRASGRPRCPKTPPGAGTTSPTKGIFCHAVLASFPNVLAPRRTRQNALSQGPSALACRASGVPCCLLLSDSPTKHISIIQSVSWPLLSVHALPFPPPVPFPLLLAACGWGRAPRPTAGPRPSSENGATSSTAGPRHVPRPRRFPLKAFWARLICPHVFAFPLNSRAGAAHFGGFFFSWERDRPRPCHKALNRPPLMFPFAPGAVGHAHPRERHRAGLECLDSGAGVVGPTIKPHIRLTSSPPCCSPLLTSGAVGHAHPRGRHRAGLESNAGGVGPTIKPHIEPPPPLAVLPF